MQPCSHSGISRLDLSWWPSLPGFQAMREFAESCGSTRSKYSEVDMPRVAIQARGLVKWFGEGEAQTTALKNVDLETYFGEMVYIVGPSGSGKTTLLSVLSGVLKPN